jgi:hypothetical protein
MGLHALLFHLGDWVHDERALDLAEMAAAIKQAKSEHLQFGFWGVPDIAMAQKLNQAGVTYLSGPFLGAALDKPAGMRRCTLDEIAAQRR